jgi:signal transduction histidine kinase
MKQAFADLTALVEEAGRATRTLSVELNPPVLRREGLEQALTWLATHMQERHGLAVTLDLDPIPFSPHEDERILLVQLARELLFNVVKHARTQAARLTLFAAEGALHLVVEDDGAGFDPDRLRRLDGGDGLGLFSIEERVRLFGGTVAVQAAPGQGTRVELVFPRDEG